MKSVKELEAISKDYSDARLTLSDRVRALEDELETSRRKHLAVIRHAANKAKSLRETLHNAIDESRDLFVKPKTMTVHGIKFGLQQSKDDLEWEDDEQLIKRIKKVLPDQADVLVNTKEAPSKSALKRLPAPDLKKLGINYVEGSEQVLIKDTNSDIDKFVKKLLDEGVEREAAA